MSNIKSVEETVKGLVHDAEAALPDLGKHEKICDCGKPILFEAGYLKVSREALNNAFDYFENEMFAEINSGNLRPPKIGTAKYIKFRDKVMEGTRHVLGNMVHKHTVGEYGCVSKADELANADALANGDDRIMSAYNLTIKTEGKHAIFIVTTSKDRKLTTIKLSTEK